MVCLVLRTRIHSLDGNIYAHLYGLMLIIILYMYIHNVPKHIGTLVLKHICCVCMFCFILSFVLKKNREKR